MTGARHVPRGRSARPLFPRSTTRPPPPYPEPTPEDRVVAQAAQARIRGLLGMPAARAAPDVLAPVVGDEGGSPMVAYLALLDTLHRAAALEDAKAVEGPEVMARWATVAVPRWRAVSDQAAAAEAAQPAETWAWYCAWRQDRGRGVPVCDTPEQQVPSPQAAAGVEQLTL